MGMGGKMRPLGNFDSNYFDIRKLTNPDGGYECVTQPLYDILPYPTKGGSLRFFEVPVGGGAQKSFAETNLFMPSSLPNGQAFIIQSIRLRLMLATDSRLDERRFYNAGYFVFQIGSKQYLGGTPAELDPHEDPKIEIRFNTQGTIAEVHMETGENDPGGMKLEPNNLLLIPQQFFSLQCYELPKLKGKAKLAATLYGQLYRQVA